MVCSSCRLVCLRVHPIFNLLHPTESFVLFVSIDGSKHEVWPEASEQSYEGNLRPNGNIPFIHLYNIHCRWDKKSRLSNYKKNLKVLHRENEISWFSLFSWLPYCALKTLMKFWTKPQICILYMLTILVQTQHYDQTWYYQLAI